MESYEESSSISFADVVASYQRAIIDSLINKIKLAIETTGINTIAIAGGVAKNSELRRQLSSIVDAKKIIFPNLNYCTDNGAMISYLGEIKFNLGKKSNMNFGIIPNFQI